MEMNTETLAVVTMRLIDVIAWINQKVFILLMCLCVCGIKALIFIGMCPSKRKTSVPRRFCQHLYTPSELFRHRKSVDNSINKNLSFRCTYLDFDTTHNQNCKRSLKQSHFNCTAQQIFDLFVIFHWAWLFSKRKININKKNSNNSKLCWNENAIFKRKTSVYVMKDWAALDFWAIAFLMNLLKM